MKILFAALLLSAVSAQAQDCNFRYFGEAVRVIVRTEHKPDHKQDHYDTVVWKSPRSIYFIEDSAKFYIEGTDDFLITSYEVKQLPFDAAITKWDKYYDFRTFKFGEGYRIIVYPHKEVMIVPADQKSNNWPRLFIFILFK